MKISKYIELNGAIGGDTNNADGELRSLNEIGRTLAFALQQGLAEKKKRRERYWRLLALLCLASNNTAAVTLPTQKSSNMFENI